MSLRTPRMLTAVDHNCQHPSGRCIDIIAATYPANNNNSNNSEDNDGWNLPDFGHDNGDEQDWTVVERRHRLASSQTTLNVVGSRRQPLLLLPADTTTTASIRGSTVGCVPETATTPTSVVVVNAPNSEGCAFDLSNAEAHRQQEENSSSHLLDEAVPTARLLPVARVYPISIHSHQTVANGCSIRSNGRRSQNDLLFLSSASNADPIAKLDAAGGLPLDSVKRSDDELDQLAEKYLDEEDKLNLAYYLNEYETNGCDLSELLTNLIRNLLAKLPNPAIKYKLLSLIKRVYIHNNSSAANQLLEDEWKERKNPQLDVLLFDTMLHQYLMASSFNQISAGNDYLAERKRKRRQRRGAQLAAAAATATSRRHHQHKQLIAAGSVVVRPNRQETSPSCRLRQLRNLGPESGAADNSLSGAAVRLLPASNSTTAELKTTTTTTTTAPSARLDYCYGGEQVERREFDQENESLHPALTQKLVISSTPSPSLSSSLSSIQQQQQEAISTNASGDVVVVCGSQQSARLAAVAGSSMDYSQSPGSGGGANLSRWHELNLLSPLSSSSSPTSLRAHRHRNHIGDVFQPPPSNQNIYPPAGSLFAKQQQQQQQQNYHLSADYLRQDQHPSSTERQQFQAADTGALLTDCSLIPDASQQPSWTNNSSNNIDYPSSSSMAAPATTLDDANQRQSHGINSIAFGDGSSSDWPLPPPTAAHLIPSGGSRPFLHHHDQQQQVDQWRPHFNARPSLDLGNELEEDEEEASFDYKPLVNNNSSSPVAAGSRSLDAYQWLPAAYNQRYLAGSCSNNSNSELLLHPVAGVERDLVQRRQQQQQQICQCDQCRPHIDLLPLSSQPFIGPQNNQTNPSRPTATNWPPYYQQQHLGSQRSASVQNHHQLDPRQMEQRCFSSMSVHYDDQGQPVETQTQKMAMTPLQPQQGFVHSPPADCCSTVVGNNSSRPNQQAWPPSQQQRLVQQKQATYSSLPSSPVAHRHYLAHRPLPGSGCIGVQAASAAPGTDGLWPGRRQDYPQPQPQQQQHRRQHHQSIQLKDWPYGNTQASQQQQLSALAAADSRRSHQNLALSSASSLNRHQPSASAARSATIDSGGSGSRLGCSRASNEQKQQQYEDRGAEEEEQDEEEGLEEEEDEFSGDECALVPLQAKGKLPLSVAEQMERQASNFVHQYGSAAASAGGRRSRKSNLQASGGSSKKPNLLVRRTLRVKIKKSKPILGIAIEGGFNVSGQLLPRVVCVHEDGAAYQCGKLRASDLILEVNGNSTVNMTHDQIARTIATAYYQDPRPYIEFLIGESMHAA